ncbi:MAG TPA: Hsp20/alpha crystallin family protein [Spirochaetia bacterium]|nr:Hsp20/alpha crystallin family protein [Spirochaetia bacterium]
MAEKTIERKTKYLRPRSAVSESKDGKLRVRIEMPGVRKEDLDIRVENNEMRIIGRREHPASRPYILHERPEGDYLQIFTLDDTVDQGKVDAVLDKGVLSITLDLKDQVKPRTIQIRSE